jgi:hypothetical protein
MKTKNAIGQWDFMGVRPILPEETGKSKQILRAGGKIYGSHPDFSAA